ncbi:metallophosphoesterase [Psychroserpens luteolus]|uniref:metallophosphoesterase n=1 Tax=Psychroserpens luteolus TaxID=2855840 RepID=UPI001E61B945|nr:metallophosphoesterase [Psychroserpens luteolus]MCD2258798.1 metallophosphoesterase [Psychroserpens luteolus]
MKKRVLRYLKHITVTILTLAIAAILFGLYHGASVHYGDHPKQKDLSNEGPYVFYENDSIMSINYVKGNKNEGFYVDKTLHQSSKTTRVTCYFPLDDTTFEFDIKSDFESPKAIYNDGNKILAISDIESGYKTFRDFLINSQVIDTKLNWTFGKGHLVLVGDFVDRGNSVTQVLWFIYKLEQEASKHGGQVHFILGNHELKNMYGDYEAAEHKYIAVSRILGKQQYQLYDKNSFIGKWLSSKNTIERINGHLFVHGGIHPNLAKLSVDINAINNIVRKHYYQGYYPKQEAGIEQFLTATKTGPSWYRGYFKDDLSQDDIELGLKKFDAKAVIVGHTIQTKVKRLFKGKVIAIDVQHPKDYHKNFPSGASEGLLIENNNYYRVLDDGRKKSI